MTFVAEGLMRKVTGQWNLHLMFSFSNPKSVILVLNSFHLLFFCDSDDKLLFGRDNADSCMYKVSAVWIFFWTPFVSSGVLVVSVYGQTFFFECY
jgi:hypothetical protein